MFGGQRPFPTSSSVVPVIWDRARQQDSLSAAQRGFAATAAQGEGFARPIMPPMGAVPPGGGGSPLNLSTTPRAPEPFKWTGGQRNAFTETPSGVRVSVAKDANGNADVIFYRVKGSGQGALNTLPKGQGSTKNALDSLTDVYTALKGYVAQFKPRALYFTPASDSHAKVYDKIAPHLARELGGIYGGRSPADGEHVIDFPDNPRR